MPKFEEMLQARDVLSRSRLPVVMCNIKPLRLYSLLSLVFEEHTKETEACEARDVENKTESLESSTNEDDETEMDIDTYTQTENVHRLKRKHASA